MRWILQTSQYVELSHGWLKNLLAGMLDILSNPLKSTLHMSSYIPEASTYNTIDRFVVKIHISHCASVIFSWYIIFHLCLYCSMDLIVTVFSHSLTYTITSIIFFSCSTVSTWPLKIFVVVGLSLGIGFCWSSLFSSVKWSCKWQQSSVSLISWDSLCVKSL